MTGSKVHQGKKGKKLDLDSFLVPLLERMLAYESVPTLKWDPTSQKLDTAAFTLRAHLLSVSGDMPGISKARKKTTYYLTTAKQKAKNNPNYRKLPARTHCEIPRQAEELEGTTQKQLKKKMQVDYGMNGKGEYKSAQILDNASGKHQADYVISDDVWEIIAKEIEASNRSTPSQTLPTVGPIKNKSQWTAETCSYFLMFLGPIVMKDRLPERYFQHFVALSDLAKSLTATEIPLVALQGLENSAVQWMKRNLT
ncbi:hypothetical protein QFC20_007659 [Naganishia adeliensis]|uniref:Uncharacterized protein n=1 Tax=Naganishia adeliensis TaxID=92952 RepID=A0ACC2UW77_9TREE|nr:hypothetical protein QFC20_007659 [Naganishia adeliensis]